MVFCFAKRRSNTIGKKREELEKEYAQATAQLEQYQHKGQRLENRIKYYQQGGQKKAKPPSYHPWGGD